MKQKKITFVVVAALVMTLGAAIFFNGCGSGSSSETGTVSFTIKGI